MPGSNPSYSLPAGNRGRNTPSRPHGNVMTDGVSYLCCSHLTRSSSWLPPPEAWPYAGGDLPFGWEPAVDANGKPYYIK